jgi:hypothetical protein
MRKRWPWQPVQAATAAVTEAISSLAPLPWRDWTVFGCGLEMPLNEKSNWTLGHIRVFGKEVCREAQPRNRRSHRAVILRKNRAWPSRFLELVGVARR